MKQRNICAAFAIFSPPILKSPALPTELGMCRLGVNFRRSNFQQLELLFKLNHYLI
jgi:hypothetical protein